MAITRIGCGCFYCGKKRKNIEGWYEAVLPKISKYSLYKPFGKIQKHPPHPAKCNNLDYIKGSFLKMDGCAAAHLYFTNIEAVPAAVRLCTQDYRPTQVINMKAKFKCVFKKMLEKYSIFWVLQTKKKKNRLPKIHWWMASLCYKSLQPCVYENSHYFLEKNNLLMFICCVIFVLFYVF